MKKIFVVLLLLLFSNAYSQRIVYPFGQSGIVRFSDSSKIFTVKSDTSIRMLGKVDFPDNTRFNGFNYFYNGTYFYDSLNVSGAIVIMDSLKISDGITWGGTSSIRAELDNLLFKSIGYQFLTQHGTQTATLDSINGFHLYYGVYTGDGSGLTNLNGNALSDTNAHLYKNRSDTITGILNFNVIPTVASFFQNIGRTIQYWLPNSLSDTLLTRSQTQTLTNKTIDAANNTITIKRAIMTFSPAPISAPADATTYYFGSIESSAPESTAGIRRIYFPVACTIKACIGAVRTATAGSSESVELYIEVNGTPTTVSTAWAWTGAAAWTTVSNTSLNIAIAAGDYIEFKIIAPTWGTNPGAARIDITISIE